MPWELNPFEPGTRRSTRDRMLTRDCVRGCGRKTAQWSGQCVACDWKLERGLPLKKVNLEEA
jgi:hypothetical protein